MKIINLFLFLISPTFYISSSIHNDSFISISSFEVEINEESNKATLLTSYTSTQESTSLSCYFEWYLYKDGVKSPLHSIRKIEFIKESNKYLNAKPEIDISILGYENIFELILRPSDMGGKTITKTLKFNNKGKSEVTFSEKDNNVGVTSEYIIESYSSFNEDKNFILEDRIVFLNFEDLLVEEVYNNFDISHFEFKYTGNKKKSLLEGELLFLLYDKYNLFNNLPIYKDSQYRYLSLTCVIKNNEISSFIYKDKLYFDPLTHNPSISYIEGYEETNKLFFPKGELDNLKSLHCLLLLNVNGYTNFKMTGEFDMYFLKNYFGDCSDSEYCIEMNDDEGDNIREKIVEVEL